ncbi:MAG: isoleucine--tRNA ligase [Candidatus Pacebacteria bacterium CG_4_10_14_0_8_um_filter_43_12]|nr:MAG: isoleucine--tRNA ligase [Candidatus Pacebacteria bacterium CG_4_10_14_0_8_um_filter_43_12]
MAAIKTVKSLPKQANFPELEQKVMVFWRDQQIFKQSVDQRPADKQYVFYDGPPFATGMPHYGHLLGSTSKDVIPRYWTMKGYRVERVWGWDCHGLPIENMIEKKLKIQGGKKGIEQLGIDTFNAACHSEVLRLDKEWEKIIERLGRWVDFEHNYKTMDLSYMESVWWGFKQLAEKNLIYEGRKVVLYCPRCATPLSNFEIAMDNSYQNVEDNSVYVKFKLTGSANQYFLAWTTTPWTLPGNVGLAVKPDAEYILVQAADSNQYWLAKDLLTTMFTGKLPAVLKTVKGNALVGQHYQPLFEYVKSDKPSAWSVLPAEFVSLAEGTGIVHTAAIFGEDDYALAQQHDLPLVPTLDDNGLFLPFVSLVAGQFYKKAEEPILADLTARQLVYRQEKTTHSYPFCYRCGTPLYYNAVPAWFIDVQQLKPALLAENEKMNWFPAHLKHGRFGKGIETAPDWNISRSRYWGTPMPVWAATQTDGQPPLRRIIGSLEELKQWAVDPSAVDKLTDIHREFLDQLEVWVDDAKTIKGRRIPEVFDCWVESGSMPYASKHYPFENKSAFETTYPAQFVSEYIAQTRAWFYTMHVVSVGIFGKLAVQNTLTTGTVLAEDGTKMSKSKNNFPDPMVVIDKYGADSLRLYLMSSPVMRAENLNFNEQDVAEIRKKVFLIWWNCLVFYKLYAGETSLDLNKTPTPFTVMDRWIQSKLHSLIKAVTESMDGYDVLRASRLSMEFVTDLSTWYLRRSRDQLKESSDDQHSVHLFGTVLVRLAQLMAPFTPFFSEVVYQAVVDQVGSVHLTDWPEFDATQIDVKLEQAMTEIRKVVERAHAARIEAGIKVRQPLAQIHVSSAQPEPSAELVKVLLDEVNVKAVAWQSSSELSVSLETSLTPALKAEGEARELIRTIQKLRKQTGLKVTQSATATVTSIPQDWQTKIEQKTHTKLKLGDQLALEVN